MPLLLLAAIVLIVAAVILTILAARNKVPLWYAVLCLALLALLKAWPIG
jgi:hypothetical protein